MTSLSLNEMSVLRFEADEFGLLILGLVDDEDGVESGTTTFKDSFPTMYIPLYLFTRGVEVIQETHST